MGIRTVLEKKGREIVGRDIPMSFTELSLGREQDFTGIDGDISAIRIARERASWWTEVAYKSASYLGDIAVGYTEKVFSKGREVLEQVIPSDLQDRVFDDSSIKGEE